MQNSLTIGHSYKDGVALRWKNTPNGHIFVTGQSGAGKSYFLQNLILECYHFRRVGKRTKSMIE